MSCPCWSEILVSMVSQPIFMCSNCASDNIRNMASTCGEVSGDLVSCSPEFEKVEMFHW